MKYIKIFEKRKKEEDPVEVEYHGVLDNVLGSYVYPRIGEIEGVTKSVRWGARMKDVETGKVTRNLYNLIDFDNKEIYPEFRKEMSYEVSSMIESLLKIGLTPEKFRKMSLYECDVNVKTVLYDENLYRIRIPPKMVYVVGKFSEREVFYIYVDGKFSDMTHEASQIFGYNTKGVREMAVKWKSASVSDRFFSYRRFIMFNADKSLIDPKHKRQLNNYNIIKRMTIRSSYSDE